MLRNFAYAVMGFILAGSLTACGYEPLNAPRQSAAEAPSVAVRIEPIADRKGQILHNALRDELNPFGMPSNPTHKMQVTLTERIRSLSGIPAEDTTRRILVGTANVTLTTLDNSRPALKQRFQTEFRFSGFANRFVSSEPEDQAREKALRLLAKEIALYVRVQTR